MRKSSSDFSAIAGKQAAADLRRSAPGWQVDFAEVKAAAMCVLLELLKRWLPDGRQQGHEYLARNPRRCDREIGSFKINLRTGQWADFATGDRGGDPISLAAYLFALRQFDAAQRLAAMLGLSRQVVQL